MTSTNWTKTTRSTTTWNLSTINAANVIYLVSNNLDIYLVGASSDQPLVTQDATPWTKITRP